MKYFKVDWILSIKIMAVMIPLSMFGYLEFCMKDSIIAHNQRVNQNIFEYKKCVNDFTNLGHKEIPSKKACRPILNTPTNLNKVFMLPHWEIGDEYILKSEDL